MIVGAVHGKDETQRLALAAVDVANNGGKDDGAGHCVDQRLVGGFGLQLLKARFADAEQISFQNGEYRTHAACQQAVQVLLGRGGRVSHRDVATFKAGQQRQNGGRDDLVHRAVGVDGVALH